MIRPTSTEFEAIEMEVCWETPPDEIINIIKVADRLLKESDADRLNQIPMLVNSNYFIAYHALRQIIQLGLAGENRFCEWGSGLGVVTCIAAQLGFDASGIEIEAALCEFSTTLAREAKVDAVFYASSYRDPVAIRQADRASVPFPIGDSISDVVYVYPWPSEEGFVETLFRQVARPSTVLVSYHGGTKQKVRRIKSATG